MPNEMPVERFTARVMEMTLERTVERTIERPLYLSEETLAGLVFMYRYTEVWPPAPDARRDLPLPKMPGGTILVL